MWRGDGRGVVEMWLMWRKETGQQLQEEQWIIDWCVWWFVIVLMMVVLCDGVTHSDIIP